MTAFTSTRRSSESPLAAIAARSVSVVMLTFAGACAQLGGPTPVPTDQPGSFGVLDPTYDRAKWRWVRNPDGRSLLAHATVHKCFIDPRPADDFNDPGFVVKRERKTIGNTSYDVLNVFQGRDFWEAVYRRDGAREPLLGVYADGACRAEAERILETYERGKT